MEWSWPGRAYGAGDRSPRSWIRVGIGVVVLALGIGLSWWFVGKLWEPVPTTESGVAPATRAGSVEKPPITAAPMAAEGVMVSPRKQQLIGVKTEKAQVRPLTHTIRTVGLVEVDETKLRHVHTKLEGWVQKLYVKFTGEEVRKGQKLFEIYSPELVSTQEEYLLALKAVRTLGDSEFPEVAENARSLLEVTRQRFALWDITPDHIEDLERTGKVLQTLPLHAPSSGYVLNMQVRDGMHVTPARELYTLADLSPVWVLAELYEYEIPLVRLGEEAAITFPYFPGKVFTGKVAYIYPVLEPKTRTVKVRFELPNPGWKLKPGMFANVELQISRGERLVVPSTAVLDSGTEQLVFVDRGQGMFEPRKVTTGVRTRDWYEILEGIEPGEPVVTSGNFLIDSESNLKAATEMMMPGMDMGTKEEPDSSTSMPGMQH